MARSRKVVFCSEHGGPFAGRAWGGHKSKGCQGFGMSHREYLRAGGRVGRNLSRGRNEEPHSLRNGLMIQLADLESRARTLRRALEKIDEARASIRAAISNLES